MKTTTKTDAALTQFIRILQDRLMAYKERAGLTYFESYAITIEAGRKYAKVLRSEYRDGKDVGQQLIVAFVDVITGEIFKPATYRAPAKHSRGNIFSATNGAEALDAAGFVRYLA